MRFEFICRDDFTLFARLSDAPFSLSRRRDPLLSSPARLPFLVGELGTSPAESDVDYSISYPLSVTSPLMIRKKRGAPRHERALGFPGPADAGVAERKKDLHRRV